MNELKIGDIVEVCRTVKWEDRIFIKYGSDNSILCVSKETESCYNNGLSFSIEKWSEGIWRHKKEKKYVPLTTSDDWIGILKGEYLKIDEYLELVTQFDTKRGYVAVDDRFYTLDDLFKNFTFENGQPIGKLEDGDDL